MESQGNNQKSQENKGKDPTFFFLTQGLQVSSMITGLILAPMLLFGLIGYTIGKYTDSLKLSLGISLIIDYFVTNWMIYKKAPDITKKIKDSN